MDELAFVGLGSNMGDRAMQMTTGLAAVAADPQVELIAVSSLYSSPPVGMVEQPDFLNAVALLRTARDAADLLRLLHEVEARHHRRRGMRWGPRTLDLDLLLYGRRRSRCPALKLPHPHLLRRAFVLAPLVELAPDLRHPDTGLPVRRYLATCSRAQAVTRLGRFPALSAPSARKDHHGSSPALH